jgi:hypothetical protein
MKKSLLLLALLGSAQAFAQPKESEKKNGKKTSKVLVISNVDTTTIDLSKVSDQNKSLPHIEVKEVKENGKTIKTISVISNDKSLNLDSLMKTIRIESDEMSSPKQKKVMTKEVRIVTGEMAEQANFQVDSIPRVIILESVASPAAEKMEIVIDGQSLGMNKKIKIKSMDGNFDFESLNMNGDFGNVLMLSDSTKWLDRKKSDNKIVLFIDGDTTEIKLPKKEVKKKKAISSVGVIDIGFNQWMYAGNGITPTAPNALLEMNSVSSLGVNLYQLKSVKLIGEKIRLQTGIGYESGNYKFSNNIGISSNGRDSLFVTEYKDGSSLIKTKLRTGYVDVPLMLEYRSHPFKESKGFRLAVGVEGGYRLGSLVKRVYTDAAGEEHKTKTRGNYLLSDIKYAATARIGFDDWNFFARYGLTNVFRSDVVGAPDVRPVMFGITLGGF